LANGNSTNWSYFEGEKKISKKIKIPYFDKQVLACQQHIAGILFLFLFFLMSFGTCSQIWLKTSCERSPTHLPHKTGKKQKKKETSKTYG
jgi:hypothetical protein